MSTLKQLYDLTFPAYYTCLLCDREVFGEVFCKACAKRIVFNDGATCPVCGRRTERPEICLECKANAPLYRRAVSPLVYSDGVISLISKFKNGQKSLADYFAALIADKLTGFEKIDCIVYVPVTLKTLIKRGYNQGKALACKLSERIYAPVIKNCVKKVRNTPAQKGLKRSERIGNLKGAFKVVKRDEIKGKSVLLLDDVLTTGATADELSRILLSAGAKCVYVASVASVEDKS